MKVLIIFACLIAVAFARPDSQPQGLSDGDLDFGRITVYPGGLCSQSQLHESKKGLIWTCTCERRPIVIFDFFRWVQCERNPRTTTTTSTTQAPTTSTSSSTTTTSAPTSSSSDATV